MSDSLPSPKAELERKVIEVLEEKVNLCETHRLDKFDLALIGKVLWAVSAGLVDSEVSSYCSNVANSFKTRLMTSHWIGRGNLITVIWDANTSGFIVQTVNTTTLKLHNKVIEGDVGEREPKLAALFNTLAAAGYIEAQ